MPDQSARAVLREVDNGLGAVAAAETVRLILFFFYYFFLSSSNLFLTFPVNAVVLT